MTDNDNRSEILSKRKIDSEIWYNHEMGCYMVKIDIWPKYPTPGKNKKSVIIRLHEKDLWWVDEGMVSPQTDVDRPHKCEDFIPQKTSVDYDWYKHTYDDFGEKLGEKHAHYECKICNERWCELANPIGDGYTRILIDENNEFVFTKEE